MSSRADDAAVFRPRMSPAAFAGAVATLVAYGVLKFVLDLEGFAGEYPFGIGAVVGLAVFAARLARDFSLGIEVATSGLRTLDGETAFQWREVTAIDVDVVTPVIANSATRARAISLRAGHKSIRFADLGTGAGPSVDGILNLEGAPLIAAIAAARTDSEALFPATWTSGHKKNQASDDGKAASDSVEGAPGLQREVKLPRWRGMEAAGVLAVIVKVLPKLFKVAAGLFKTVKPGAAIATVAAYSLVFSWKFALALVVMVLVHECGHVYAMWRSGIPVRGIYMIPFVGGVAVGSGTASSRRADAYVALNGPVFGTVLALLCWGLATALGESGVAEFFAAAAAWGALLNLFNLLPIFPLDGGRTVASLAHGSPAALPLIFASLALGGLLAYVAHLELLFLVALVGLAELGEQVSAVPFRPALAMLPGIRPLAAAEHEHFSRFVAPVEKGRNSETKVAARKQLFERRSAAAHQRPMTIRERGVVLLAYLGLIGVLVATLVSLNDIPGAGNPLDFLR